ncbi:PrsW family intramembrane metalloprotease [Arthrobacter sp. zg-Y40]|uniref:PrsW family intramembrane metalloprotease n=1 Tax=Arthrobacter sp. zg-Y40 TaxID=2886939 RepID=UPI001D147B72|nr:PrsW family intramembrane metalloprotease [Arthrobacter sp. zg-Y40]MCC3279159.1 PrsW family intramembrane metalloprotease [Arthrobacter sp. zg-Y40]
MSAPGFQPAPQQYPGPPGYAPAYGPAPVQPFWVPPEPRRDKGLAATIVLTVLSAAALAWVGMGLIDRFGSPAFVICGILALIPLGICFLGIWWVDRWEPEPRSALLFSFLWGAGVSVVIALLLGPYFTLALLDILPYTSAEILGLVLEAPVVEETAKGLGILILLLARRRIFDGPVDGIVFAASVAAGFAFTENILYFGTAMVGSDWGAADLGFTFVLRGLLSPFAHVLFTACTGLALGLAASRAGRGWILPAFILGLIPAILGHMLWNGGPTFFFEDNFFVFYFLLQVPLFALAVTGVWMLRRKEQRLTLRRLDEYAMAGWFTPAEVRMLATGNGRRQAMSWARLNGSAGTMKEFIRRSTRLALTRQQIAVGRDVAANQEYEATLLAEVTGIRAAMLAGARV